MSGIYIPGVEKSKTCVFCRFCDGIIDTQSGPCAYCVVDGKVREADTTLKDCPLVPVPDHGRLIDAGFLLSEYDKIHVGKPGGARLLIANAPTIIPEDKEGEG